MSQISFVNSMKSNFFQPLELVEIICQVEVLESSHLRTMQWASFPRTMQHQRGNIRELKERQESEKVYATGCRREKLYVIYQIN